ncbi:MAG: hypothetical protein ACJZ7Z_04770 [Myxococcota bacterium]|nr:MAG: hypothetical protein CBC32_014735 [Proteobacteria bacterium TMED72]
MRTQSVKAQPFLNSHSGIRTHTLILLGVFAWMSIAGSAFAGGSESREERDSRKCVVDLQRAGRNHARCLFEAEIRYTRSGHQERYDEKVLKCDQRHDRDFRKAMRRYPQAECTTLSQVELENETKSHVARYVNATLAIANPPLPAPLSGPTITYTAPTCSGPYCDWTGPLAATLEPYPENRKQKLPVTSCTGMGTELSCTVSPDGGFGTIVSSMVPYTSQYLTVPLTVDGQLENGYKDGSDVSCFTTTGSDHDMSGCGVAVLSEYNCFLLDGHTDVDLLGVQGDSSSANYVSGGNWPDISTDSEKYATYDCLQRGTVNGEDNLCVTRQYPTVTHGFYGALPAKTDTRWPVPTNEDSGACKNHSWAEMTTSSKPGMSWKKVPTQAILQRQLEFFEYYTSHPPAEDNPDFGPMIDLPPNKYKDENGNYLTQAVLSVGHGVVTDLCGDLSLASNGPKAILQMSIGTRSWSYESNSAAYLDYDPGIPGMHQKLHDLPTGLSSACDNAAGNGIQPWVQSFDWDDFPTS